MNTRLTILCDNSVGMPFGGVGEHGFACHIETDNGHYLFDTGQGLGILQNAAALKKDLRRIDSVMISHGHYDHTGGLPSVLSVRGPVDVYGHPDMFVERSWSDGTTRRFIGIPYRRGYLESLGARFKHGSDWVEVGPGIHLTGEIPRKTVFETGDPRMTALREDGSSVHPDPLSDDLSVVVESDRGLIIVLGCAHAGMINIMDDVLEKFKRDRIYAVIGGTHLGFSTKHQFEETLKAIDRFNIERIGVSHCTGLEKAAMLHARLGERFFFGCVGAVLTG
jgi:7,8-dihydropterin-6-yl-methyl-4-(beta-D-ribofuranosyl)aminobenzene 5'-phosphate synthase